MHFPSNIGTSQTQLKNNSRDKKKVQVIDTRQYSNSNIIFEYTILNALKISREYENNGMYTRRNKQYL